MVVQEPQAVPESELPLVLPETDNFKPSGSPESPLANISDWVSFTDPETGHYQLPHLHPSLTPPQVCQAPSLQS